MVLPHEVLGVSVDADFSTIKRAFRSLAKEWHPDRNRDPRASIRFRELVSAYRTLAHDHARRLHGSRWSEPQENKTARPVPVTAAVDFNDDVSWVERPRTDMAIAYPAKLARIVVFGTLGVIAVFWISAFLTQL